MLPYLVRKKKIPRFITFQLLHCFDSDSEIWKLLIKFGSGQACTDSTDMSGYSNADFGKKDRLAQRLVFQRKDYANVLEVYFTAEGRYLIRGTLSKRN